MIYIRLDESNKPQLLGWACGFANQFPLAQRWNGKGCNRPSQGDVVLWFRDNNRLARESALTPCGCGVPAFVVNIVVAQECDIRQGELGAPGQAYYEIGCNANEGEVIYSLVTNLELVIPSWKENLRICSVTEIENECVLV